MNARAADADKDADVPGCPSRVLVALAVSACLVGFQLDQLLERGLVLRRAVDWSSRHDVDVSVANLGFGVSLKNDSSFMKAVNKDGLERSGLEG